MNIKNLLREIYYIFAYKKMKIEEMDYESYWKNREPDVFREGSDNTERIILTNVEAGSTLLDIGCGDGRLLSFLKSKKNINGEGIDVSEIAAERCKKKGIRCRIMDIKKEFKLNEKYDYVVITDVLEHIPNPEIIMKNVKNVFKKKLIISLPNIGIVFNRLRLLFGKFPLDWYWHPAEHLRHWTLADIRWWIRTNNFGYRIVKIYPHTGIPLLRKVWPSLFAAGFVIILENE